jgi:hypothetical protein
MWSIGGIKYYTPVIVKPLFARTQYKTLHQQLEYGKTEKIADSKKWSHIQGLPLLTYDTINLYHKVNPTLRAYCPWLRVSLHYLKWK